ncbi:MAG: ComF family protein [Bacteroidaceae bacterium]|nr:ComF family protein [Bacteroidaceae bacterium]
MFKLPLLHVSDRHDNLLLRRLWTEVDVVAGASLMSYRHFSPFSRMITNFKYHGDTSLGIRLGEFMCHELDIKHWEEKIDVIVPMPMNKRRKKEYGYNQTLYLAKGIAKVLNCEVCEWLKRTDSLPSQTTLSGLERTERKITLEVHIPAERRGLTLLFVDDVVTSGSTMRQCVAALTHADPTAKICVATLATAE